MHMAWVRVVCGRLESRYHYSAKLVYNNFPWPDAPDAAARAAVEAAATAVLAARTAHPTATLVDLYDRRAMPRSLRQAHTALDRLVDRLYRRGEFDNDRARVEFLFARYAGLSAPLLPVKGRGRKG